MDLADGIPLENIRATDHATPKLSCLFMYVHVTTIVPVAPRSQVQAPLPDDDDDEAGPQ